MGKPQLKTDWVCIATAGATVDGRTISEQDLYDMAETYDPEKYQALIWWEHYRFFSNLGEVLRLKAETVDGKVKLFAELRPTAELVQLNQNGQKKFTSIEIMPNFAKTGKAYLGGLAVTDSPASTGTTKLEFSALGIKEEQELIFGDHEEFYFSLSQENGKEGLVNALIEVFSKFSKFTGNNSESKPHIEPTFSNNNNDKEENQPMDKEQFNQLIAAVNGLGDKIDEKFSQQSTEPTPEPAKEPEVVTAEKFNALEEKYNALEEKFNALSKTEVTQVPNGAGGEEKQKFNMAV